MEGKLEEEQPQLYQNMEGENNNILGSPKFLEDLNETKQRYFLGGLTYEQANGPPPPKNNLPENYYPMRLRHIDPRSTLVNENNEFIETKHIQKLVPFSNCLLMFGIDENEWDEGLYVYRFSEEYKNTIIKIKYSEIATPETYDFMGTDAYFTFFQSHRFFETMDLSKYVKICALWPDGQIEQLYVYTENINQNNDEYQLPSIHGANTVIYQLMQLLYWSTYDDKQRLLKEPYFKALTKLKTKDNGDNIYMFYNEVTDGPDIAPYNVYSGKLLAVTNNMQDPNYFHNDIENESNANDQIHTFKFPTGPAIIISCNDNQIESLTDLSINEFVKIQEEILDKQYKCISNQLIDYFRSSDLALRYIKTNKLLARYIYERIFLIRIGTPEYRNICTVINKYVSNGARYSSSKFNRMRLIRSLLYGSVFLLLQESLKFPIRKSLYTKNSNIPNLENLTETKLCENNLFTECEIPVNSENNHLVEINKRMLIDSSLNKSIFEVIDFKPSNPKSIDTPTLPTEDTLDIMTDRTIKDIVVLLRHSDLPFEERLLKLTIEDLKLLGQTRATIKKISENGTPLDKYQKFVKSLFKKYSKIMRAHVKSLKQKNKEDVQSKIKETQSDEEMTDIPETLCSTKRNSKDEELQEPPRTSKKSKKHKKKKDKKNKKKIVLIENNSESEEEDEQPPPLIKIKQDGKEKLKKMREECEKRKLEKERLKKEKQEIELEEEEEESLETHETQIQEEKELLDKEKQKLEKEKELLLKEKQRLEKERKEKERLEKEKLEKEKKEKERLEKEKLEKEKKEKERLKKEKLEKEKKEKERLEKEKQRLEKERLEKEKQRLEKEKKEKERLEKEKQRLEKEKKEKERLEKEKLEKEKKEKERLEKEKQRLQKEKKEKELLEKEKQRLEKEKKEKERLEKEKQRLEKEKKEKERLEKQKQRLEKEKKEKERLEKQKQRLAEKERNDIGNKRKRDSHNDDKYSVESNNDYLESLFASSDEEDNNDKKRRKMNPTFKDTHEQYTQNIDDDCFDIKEDIANVSTKSNYESDDYEL